MAKVCVGCGAALQTTDESSPGYVPESARNNETVICRRCFRIQNYGEFSRAALPVERYAKEVSLVMKKPGLVLYVLDVFDLTGSFVPSLREYIGDSPVLAVVNKVDVLPRDTRVKSLRRWILDSLAYQGVHAVDVAFVSAETGEGFEQLKGVIENRRENRIYAVGMANVGKSSLLNRLTQLAGAGHPFTESRVPGTTLGVSQVELLLSERRRVTILDTPGLIMENRATDVLCPDCLKTVVPSVRLRPRVFQVLPGQTLFLGNFARLDFAGGEAQSIVCYVSNDLVIHRTKQDNADAFQALHEDDILKTPCESCRSALGPYLTQAVEIHGGDKAPSFRRDKGTVEAGRDGCDLVLSGVGWISLTGFPFEGRISYREGVSLAVRPRLIGSLNKPSTGRPKVGIKPSFRKYT